MAGLCNSRETPAGDHLATAHSLATGARDLDHKIRQAGDDRVGRTRSATADAGEQQAGCCEGVGMGGA